MTDKMRERFEAWISAPPFEHMCDRRPMDERVTCWPGQYKRYETELAWEAWQAALAQPEQRGEAWYGHRFKEREPGIWRCDCKCDITLYQAPPVQITLNNSDEQPAPAVPDDTARLNWLEAREASLVTHREAIDEGEFAIWWTVAGEVRKIRANSISGHPLGSARAAIDAAMLAAAPEVKP